MLYLAVVFVLGLAIAPAVQAQRCGEGWGQVTSKFVDEVYPLLDALPPVKLPIPGTVDNVAVLVEPREDPCIRFVIKNVLHFLPEGEWSLQIMHGRDNLEYIKDEIRDHVDLDRVVFTSFYDVIMRIDEERPFPKWISDKWDEWWAKLKPIEEQTGKWNINREIYSQGLLAPWFWEPIIAEHILIFQTDSWLCDYGAERYTNYDFVGAKWRMCDQGEDHIFWGHCMAGNGGLSLRSRAKALQLCQDAARSTINEDYQFALWFKKYGANVPSQELKREIFSEELQPKTRNSPIGIHKIWHYQNAYAVKEILRECMAPLRGFEYTPKAGYTGPHHDEL